MLYRMLCLLLCAALLPAGALAAQGAYLSMEDLQSIQPAYEAFLEELAALLVERGLLAEEDVEDWMLYQLGDFLQNGGFGSIMALYTPGLLSMADNTVTLGRLSVQTNTGQLVLETLQYYSPERSSLPGLPLDTTITDAEGREVACRFRWIAPTGMLMVWDETAGQVVEVGATYISDGRPLYWFEEPAEGLTEELTLEILHAVEDRELARVTLRLRVQDGCWMPEAMQ